MIKHLGTTTKTIVVLASLGLLTACGAVGRTVTANTSDYDADIAANAEIHDLGTEEYLITEIDSGDISIESVYCNYIENILTPQIEDYFEIPACKIDVSYSNGEIVSAEIRVVTEKDETNALETDIIDYVSKALGISTENITLSFDDSSENVTKEEGIYVYNEESQISEIALSFSLKKISPTGATLVFDQYDADAPKGELSYGEDYVIEVLKDGKWEETPITVEGDYAFYAIGYNLPCEKISEKEIDWHWLYGELAPGEYRIGKGVIDLIESGNFDEYMVYAHFTLNSN